MRLPQSIASFVGGCIRLLASAFLAGGLGMVFLPLGLHAERAAKEENIFQSTNLLRISIEISGEGLTTLRNPFARRHSGEKPDALATVVEGARTYTNVTVQLKGFTTFQPIDGLPSLTLNFEKLAPKQKFHGLTKISLNNSLQDATRLHEKFSRELFAAAGVPVPRADYALVTLNGRELGLYVLAEGFGKDFLKRHFARSDGNLYEGGILKDIDQPLQLSPGRNPTNHAAVQRLISASREADPEKRWRALEAALDMDRFLSMMALETMLCHSDSYSMNRNNYRLYHDPDTDRIVFMPHGMDRVLGTHRSPLDLCIVTPAMGMVARGILSTPEGRRRYVERAGVLFTNLFQPETLCDRVREIDAKIIAAKTNWPADHRFDGRRSSSHLRDANDLCQRVSQRAADLKLQFAEPSELWAPTPAPVFDSNGIARIDGWKLRRRPASAEVSCEVDEADRKPGLHLCLSKGPVVATLRAKVLLPPGKYHVIGDLTTINGAGTTNYHSLTLQRYSAARFAVERHLNVNSFQVSEARASEEIEFICDVRDQCSEVWFDASTLRLVRQVN
jgi:spore coat protein H